jgi:hypothetical protein
MRPIEAWDESDLHALIAAGVQESLTLDYKSSDALQRTDGKKNEISKDVSAFANAAGGMIVYGVVENDHLPERVDGGCDPAVITREWLDQVIKSNIQPRLQDYRIKHIDLANGNVAFVVEVQQARGLGPHQANDKKYYRRFEFESVPMNDYEIRDVMNRASPPELEIEWIYTKHRVGGDAVECDFTYVLHNRSSEIALYGSTSLCFDAQLEPTAMQSFYRQDAVLRMDRQNHKAVIDTRTFAVPTDHPVYREKAKVLGANTLTVRLNVRYYVSWIVHCPGYSRTMWGYVEFKPHAGARMTWFDTDGEVA